MQVLKSVGISIAGIVVTTAGCAPLPQGCIPVDKEHAAIYQPGHYCLTESMHVRFEMADRWAETDLITIWANDVQLDLRGHYLTQNGRNNCITIADRSISNITIKNGTLRNCGVGVWQYPAPYDGQQPIHDAKKNSYYFPVNEFHLENITFEDNKQNFRIRMPPKPVDPNRPRATRYGPDCPQGCRVE